MARKRALLGKWDEGEVSSDFPSGGGRRFGKIVDFKIAEALFLREKILVLKKEPIQFFPHTLILGRNLL